METVAQRVWRARTGRPKRFGGANLPPAPTASYSVQSISGYPRVLKMPCFISSRPIAPGLHTDGGDDTRELVHRLHRRDSICTRQAWPVSPLPSLLFLSFVRGRRRWSPATSAIHLDHSLRPFSGGEWPSRVACDTRLVVAPTVLPHRLSRLVAPIRCLKATLDTARELRARAIMFGQRPGWPDTRPARPWA